MFNKNDKIPFTFNLIDGKMLIDKNLSDSNLLKKGTEIKKINHITVGEITSTLIKYVRGDGENNGQRLKEIELSGLGGT
ncbi:MAG: hypothetical protein MZV64_60820 [Ignavibacteriales bacterium]|nr:hypothetical protein [Ignavibacteriales bacterium]